MVCVQGQPGESGARGEAGKAVSLTHTLLREKNEYCHNNKFFKNLNPALSVTK